MTRRPLLARLPLLRDLARNTAEQAAVIGRARAYLDAEDQAAAALDVAGQMQDELSAVCTMFAGLIDRMAQAARADAAAFAAARAEGYADGYRQAREDADRELAAGWAALSRVVNPYGPAAAGPLPLPREDAANGIDRGPR